MLLVFVHLVIKWIPYFYSSLFLLCIRFLVNLNVIREMLQVQFQYTDYAQPAQTQLLVVTSNFEKTFGLVAADSGKHKCSI